MIEFECTPIFNKYDSENFKIYVCKVDVCQYPNLKCDKYNCISILGDMQNLITGTLYKIKAVESHGKYGVQYNVKSIRTDKPLDKTSSETFLFEILTVRQANSLLNAYPNIIDKIMKNDIDDIDFNKTPYVKEKTFEKIKRKVLENFVLIDLVDKFYGLITLKVLRKLLDTYGSSENIVHKLETNPYKCLTNLGGIGFKKADDILMAIDLINIDNVNEGKEPIIKFQEPLLESESRMRACIIYILRENENNGNTKINIGTLTRLCDNLTPQCIHHFDGILIEKKDVYYDDVEYVAISKTFISEAYIAMKIVDGLKVENKWSIDCEKYRTDGDLTLIDKQVEALSGVCKHNISVLDGKAGSGKTLTVSRLSKLLKDNNKSFIMLAPTGRAAKIISSYAEIEAQTIHRGLGFKPPNVWECNEESPLLEDAVIVDEMSMVDVDVMTNLIKAIDFNRTKLFLVGDSDQIPSVGAGNILHDIINSMTIPVTTLSEIFRYDEGGLDQVATKVRKMEKYLNDDKIQVFGIKKDYAFINVSQENMLDSLDKLYEKLIINKGVDPKDIMVLSSYNKGDYGTICVNKRLQKIANPIHTMDEDGFKVGDTTYYKNDLVMQIKNNYKAIVYSENTSEEESNKVFIANGESGKILEINKHNIIIQFDKYQIIYKREDIMDNLRLSYCVSIHKSQGGSSKYVIALTPKSHTYFLNSNLIYVALTRTKVQCYHLGNASTVNKAIKIKANFDRKTFLIGMLKSLTKHNA